MITGVGQRYRRAALGRAALGRAARPTVAHGIGRSASASDALVDFLWGVPVVPGAFQAAWAIGSNVVVMGPL